MQDSGFDYHLDLEQISDYKKLTAEQKLQWLDEIFLFTEAALSPKARRVRQNLRDGGPDSGLASTPFDKLRETLSKRQE